MRCLVTGATGLLGSHIVEKLRAAGHDVRAVVRPGSDTSWLVTQNVELCRGDVTDAESVRRAARGVDCVFHAAARVGDWGPWSEFVDITINGTRNVIDAVDAERVPRYIHVSSISVYGHVDGAGLVLDETAPLGVNLHRWSYYSRAKVAAEELVWEAHRAGRVRATSIRPSWLYGPRDRATLPRLAHNIRLGRAKLIGTGDNRLNVVYAGNVAEAAILAAEKDVAVGEAYNCSNDGVLTQRQYFNRVAEALGASPVTKTVSYAVAKKAAFLMELFGHMVGMKKPPMVTRYSVWLIGRHSFFETKKARVQLGWKPTVTYEQGIPMTVKWFLDHEANGQPAPDSVPASVTS